MALFGSKDKATKSKIVQPTVIRTQNVAREIVSLAKSYNVKPESLDFNILEVHTYTRVNDATKESEWESVQEGNLYELDDETALLNKFFQIKQTYEIEIYSINTEEENPYSNFKIAVGANASKCKVYLSIAAGSSLTYSKRLDQELRILINKKKIRAGILINIFDEMLDDSIAKISAIVRVQDSLVFKESKTILIAEGFEPTETTNDTLILHYEDKEDIDEDTKVDYASRGFIQSVREGEVLIEYIKPKLGLPGRNCRGEFMQPSEPTISNEVTFSIGDSIKEVETQNSVQYISKENGYIAFDDNTYYIKTDMDIGEVSFKTTGNIISGLDSDVNLSVKETDAVKDAIGAGMEVEVTEIDIDGNVGSNAKVTAMKATIGGQTHGSSIVRADKLDINVHKGTAFGKSVKVTRLEHGEVNGTKVNISQAVGGKIRAKEIYIEICASHVDAIASHLIEIKKLQGSENTFTIDPMIKKSKQEGLNENKGIIEKLEIEIKEISKEVEKYTQLVKDGAAAFNDIKKRLVSYKKSGVKMPSSFVKKYKQFTEVQEQLKEKQTTYGVKVDQLKLQKSKTSSFQDDICEARIINRDHWVGYNEIVFQLVKPPVRLVHKPAQGSPDKIFGVVEIEPGQYEIQAMTE
ncbi:DUF342 domain-containing protein [Sulfurimonas aquatica]|uniref:DUF342 domain-containing protein n=1 Tax=Sulfurimonas aquatica TaxID=2672570 RepID=A0A975GCL3_9BACT|nr:flagellar assembly protein A [Sulfurimonas aquatica]QSZ41632.1 DUF342 domain-containing protein [Sulfurimonas aquatica]